MTRRPQFPNDPDGDDPNDDLRDERFLTVDEVAALLRLEPADVIALLDRYELPAIRIGDDGPWRIERDMLEHYIDDRYEAQRRAAIHAHPEADDFAELWGPRIPEDVGLPSRAHPSFGRGAELEAAHEVLRDEWAALEAFADDESHASWAQDANGHPGPGRRLYAVPPAGDTPEHAGSERVASEPGDGDDRTGDVDTADPAALAALAARAGAERFRRDAERRAADLDDVADDLDDGLDAAFDDGWDDDETWDEDDWGDESTVDANRDELDRAGERPADSVSVDRRADGDRADDGTSTDPGAPNVGTGPHA